MANVINVDVASREITVDRDHDPLVAGNAGEDFVSATFDDEWDGLAVYCVYACGKNNALAAPFTPSTGTSAAQNEIPWEVLVPGSLRLTFRGYDSEDELVLETKYMRTNGIPVKAGGQPMPHREADATLDVAMAAKKRLDALEDEIGAAVTKTDEAAQEATEAAVLANAAAAAKFPMFSYAAPDLYADVPDGMNYDFEIEEDGDLYLEVVE